MIPLNDFTTKSIRDRKLMALYYAFGAFDTHPEWGLHSDDAMAFADAEEAAATAYHTERTCSLPSLMDGFRRFVAERGVAEPFKAPTV